MLVPASEAVNPDWVLPSGRCRTRGSAHLAGMSIMALLVMFSAYPTQANPHRTHTASASRGKAALAHRSDFHQKPRYASQPNRARVRPGDIDPEVVEALRAARQTIQADPFLLLAIAFKESSFDPRARSRHSSARGLLQFTSTTWLTVVRDFGARYGLGHMSAAIKTRRNGQLSVASPRERRAILALRDNPALQIAMAAERLAQERHALEASLGRPARPADLYVLHLLGPAGARDFLAQLARDPDRPSVEVVGSVAKPNLGLFVRNGLTLSTGEAYAAIEATLTEQAARHAALFAATAL